MRSEKPRLVVVVGMPGSGKGVFSDVARGSGIPVYVMGDIVREETIRRGLEPTPSNLNYVARRLREEYGPAIVAERIGEKILASREDFVVIDGSRSLYELEVFEKIGEVVIVAIHASPSTRYSRLKRRNRPGDPRSWEEFSERDRVELSFGIGSLIALADYVLVNECSIGEFREKAKKLLEGLRSKWKEYKLEKC